MKKVKEVKIIRVPKGREVDGAAVISDIYNCLKKGDRASRAIVTAAGEDVVYTIYIDHCVYDNTSDDDDAVPDDDPQPEETADEDEDDDDDDAIPFC